MPTVREAVNERSVPPPHRELRNERELRDEDDR
jgi:hypothetical protein